MIDSIEIIANRPWHRTYLETSKTGVWVPEPTYGLEETDQGGQPNFRPCRLDDQGGIVPLGVIRYLTPEAALEVIADLNDMPEVLHRVGPIGFEGATGLALVSIAAAAAICYIGDLDPAATAVTAITTTAIYWVRWILDVLTSYQK